MACINVFFHSFFGSIIELGPLSATLHGVVEEWVNRNTMRCIGLVRMMLENRLTKIVYQSSGD